MSAEAKGCTLEFNNLCYSVLVTDPDTETTVTKPLLSNITGVAKNREVTAIVGHSGAGKTTLLDCLAGRVEESSIRGEISLNGMPVRQASFRRMSGYVLQTDNLFPMLTARESLLYGAALMLSPDQYNEEQRETRVDGLLKQLDLETVRDEIVGDGVVVPGISSGSRRRVSVAMELVRNPPVVFLDEPTTGLDSSAAYQLVVMLNSLSRAGDGRNVILTIHQPGSRILREIDRVIILGEGHVVFNDYVTTLVPYLASIGFPVPQEEDALEFALDLVDECDISSSSAAKLIETDHVNIHAAGAGTDADGGVGAVEEKEGGDKDEKKQALVENTDLVALWLAHQTGDTKTAGADNTKTGLKDQADAQAVGARAGVSSLSSESDGGAGPGGDDANADANADAVAVAYANGAFAESMILAHRYLTNITRQAEMSWVIINIFTMNALVLGSVFYQTSEAFNGYQERRSFVGFSGAFVVFSAIQNLPFFLLERSIYVREASRGAYRPSSYMLGTTLVFMPFFLVQAILLTVISWYMVGLADDAGKILFMILSLFMVQCTANSQVMLTSALFNDFVSGNTAYIAATAFQWNTSGFLINSADIPVYWIWLQYISIFKYFYDSMLINVFQDSGPFGCPQGSDALCSLSAEEIMKLEDLDGVSKWSGIAVLAGMFVAYRALYLLMLFRRRDEVRK